MGGLAGTPTPLPLVDANGMRPARCTASRHLLPAPAAAKLAWTAHVHAVHAVHAVPPTGREVSELARLRGETALGWIGNVRGGEGEMVLAPSMGQELRYTPESRLIVLAEEWEPATPLLPPPPAAAGPA